MFNIKASGRFAQAALCVGMAWATMPPLWITGARMEHGGHGSHSPGTVEIPRAAHSPLLRNSIIPSAGQAIRVEVALVIVPVTVTNSNGSFVSGLKASDFHVFEDGVEQKIDSIVPDNDPFNVALMLDRSGSTQFRLEEIQAAAQSFIGALRPQDRILVASFDSDVTFHTGFTDDRNLLRGAVEQTRSSQNRTAFYDALHTAMEQKIESIAGRKSVVLFTDGVDNASRFVNGDDLLKGIERSDVIVYAIQYDTRKGARPDRMRIPLPHGMVSFETLYGRAVKYLRKLSGDSGGRLYQADTMESLQEAFAQIAEELPYQYTLCYYPAKPARSDEYRKLRIKVDRPGVKVRARAGYRTGR